MGRDDIGFSEGLGFRDTTPIMETEMEQNMENEMESRVMQVYRACRVRA